MASRLLTLQSCFSGACAVNSEWADVDTVTASTEEAIVVASVSGCTGLAGAAKVSTGTPIGLSLGPPPSGFLGVFQISATVPLRQWVVGLL